MGLETFDLPCGSAGDVAELEYIAALHQTGEKVRLDGSVKGILVVVFRSKILVAHIARFSESIPSM